MSADKNILAEINKIRDIIFLTKTWNPVMAYNNGRRLTVSEIRPLIYKSTRIQQVIDKISREERVPKSEVLAKMKCFLEEMGHNRNMTVIRWVGLALCKILRRNYSGIFVNEASVLKAKAVMGPCPVIFAPSHRSYGDFILMSFLCFYYDIEIPAIAAGMDFKGMWMVGDILRDCCAFFIKRTFGGDDLYKATFHEYISSLVTCGQSALEFFIEGTRSRSGKSLLPKFGLLTSALEQYFLGKVPDVTIIPVSITYERVLEDRLFASELLGIPKPKESTRLLFKALKFLNNNYGRIYVEFGDPLSVRAFCGNFISEDLRVAMPQNNNPIPSSYITPKIENAIKHLGYAVVHYQNCGMKYTPIHLFATAMSISILYRSEVPMPSIMTDMEALRSVFNICEELSLPVIGLPDIVYCLNIHKQFLFYDKDKNSVRIDKYMKFACNIAASSLRGHKLMESTLNDVYPIMLLQQYANSVCLRLCHLSMLTILVYINDVDLIHKDQLYDEYVTLRSLFSSEFSLMPSECCKKHNFFDAIVKLEKLNIIEFKSDDPDYFVLKKSEKNSEAFNRDVVLIAVLFPFIQGYWMTLKECCKRAEQEGNVLMMNQFVKYVQESVELNMSSYSLHGYTLSLDLIANALNTLIVLKFVERGKLEKGEIPMTIDLEKCIPLMEKLDTLKNVLWNILKEKPQEISEVQKQKCSL